MSGETNLSVLLKSMAPYLLSDDFVFITIADAKYGDHQELKPIATFQEQEGLSFIIPHSLAVKYQYRFDTLFKAITLTVHSSLDAVGLTAAISTKLAEHNISANVIAGYYHDHVFVQKDNAERAIQALTEFAS